MADDDDLDHGLRLNGLDRFRKQSPRLLLEEYSHCEVPAGCGGVVLRWVDPREGVPAILRVVVVGGGSVRAWLDGVLIESSRVTVESGERLLALELTGIERQSTAVLVELQRELGREAYGAERVVVTRSLVDGRWCASPHIPIAAWIEPEFDDFDWAPLRDGGVLLDEADRNVWRTRMMREAGTRPLALLPEQLHAGSAWIRHRFMATALDPELRREEQA